MSGLMMSSETYKMLEAEETEIFMMSPFAVFDMWECEKVSGNKRQDFTCRP